jgi:DNA gyrase subunit B
VVIAPLVEPRLTKQNVPLVRVALDTGAAVRCTPDHLFRLRDGSYRRADQLVPGDSLMPLYRTVSARAAGDNLDGYEKVWMNDREEWVYTHYLADGFNLRRGADDVKNGNVRHHIDCDKRNNDPRNIRRMTWGAHAALHAAMMTDNRERIDEGFRSWLAAGGLAFKSAMLSTQWKDPRFRTARRAEWSERAKVQWQDPDLREWRAARTREQFSDPAERERQRAAVVSWHARHPDFGAQHAELMRRRLRQDPSLVTKLHAGRDEYMRTASRSDRVAAQNDGRRRAAVKRLSGFLELPDDQLAAAYEADRLARARTGLRWDRLLDAYGGDVAQLREAAEHVNHTVVSVEALAEAADVYDLTVDHYHNFALDAGVFVHNSARMARSSEYQALLPIRGKILNVQKATLQQVLDNVECSAIVQVLGAGSGRTFDLSALRYGRVLIMADADVDGSHIRTLLITLFAKYMRPVIEAGRLFAAMPPLHKVVTKGRNPETIFTYTQQEMESTVGRLERAGKTVVKPVPRFKGLGEMDAEELWDTTMNPAVRTVRRITLNDVERAEEVLDLLMGERVEPRRNWLIESSGRIDEDAIDA